MPAIPTIVYHTSSHTTSISPTPQPESPAFRIRGSSFIFIKNEKVMVIREYLAKAQTQHRHGFAKVMARLCQADDKALPTRRQNCANKLAKEWKHGRQKQKRQKNKRTNTAPAKRLPHICPFALLSYKLTQIANQVILLSYFQNNFAGYSPASTRA